MVICKNYDEEEGEMESKFIFAKIDDGPCGFIPSITISETSSFALCLALMHNPFDQTFDSLSPSTLSMPSSRTLSVVFPYKIAYISFADMMPFTVIENNLSSISFILPV